jgi:hypothetical protein
MLDGLHGVATQRHIQERSRVHREMVGEEHAEKQMRAKTDARAPDYADLLSGGDLRSSQGDAAEMTVYPDEAAVLDQNFEAARSAVLHPQQMSSSGRVDRRPDADRQVHAVMVGARCRQVRDDARPIGHRDTGGVDWQHRVLRFRIDPSRRTFGVATGILPQAASNLIRRCAGSARNGEDRPTITPLQCSWRKVYDN